MTADAGRDGGEHNDSERAHESDAEAGDDRRHGGREDRNDDGDKKEEHGDHLANVPDGAGCTEIWEQLSSGRDDE